MNDSTKSLSKVIRIDESEIRGHLDEMVRGTVEETLNAMLDAEADEMCNAQRYEHSPDRVDTRAGSYTRKLHTKAGEVEVKVPKLRKQTFETAIIERYRRRDISIEEAIVQMYLAGVSVRRVEDITEALWGTRVSSGTVSNLNKKVYKHIERWRTQKIEGDFAYVYLDGIVLKRSWGGEIKNVSVLAAIGVDSDGYRRILGVSEGQKEDKAGWLGFLKELKKRGLSGVRLIISDACLGLVESISEVFPDADWQRCVVHFYRNVFSHVPRGKMREVAAMLKAIHAQESREAAQSKSSDVVQKLRAMKLKAAADLVEKSIHETFAYFGYPPQHWLKIKTNNPMERLLKEARRRTKVVGAFPDGNSALMLVAARLRHVSSTTWGTRKYMNMKLLNEMDQEAIYSVA
ncbi:MAG: IS256 family transposase [Desulforhopalus sp.]|jgi:transposase-like protein|nr:IS256 family transposase [Desulforhopalus sp.]